MWKNLLKILIVIIITILELLVTLPFGRPGELDSKEYSQFVNRELLLTTLPAFVVTFLFAWLLKTRGMSGAIRRSSIWTIIILINYLLIGIGNNNITIIFSTLGIYMLLLGAFLGPMGYAKIKHLE